MLSTPQPRYLPFKWYQCHNPDTFPSNAINATTRVSSLQCSQRCQQVFFPSHAINATTRLSSNFMPSAPPPGFLPLISYQRHHPGVFQSHAFNIVSRFSSLHILSTPQPGCLPISCYQRHHPVFFPYTWCQRWMAILPQSIWKNRMNSSFSFKSMIWWKGWSVLGLYEEKDELHKDDMKKRMNLSYSSNWPGAK